MYVNHWCQKYLICSTCFLLFKATTNENDYQPDDLGDDKATLVSLRPS